MGNQIQIKCHWTDAMDPELKKDFMALANTVFGLFVTEAFYKSKFEDNTYGSSLITVAYFNGQPAGADVMWRNDVNGLKAYQTVDTCVLEEFRGRGLFKKMTYYELEVIGDDTLVYGFPNPNSFPGYVRMGWHVEHLHASLFSKSRVLDIESEYAAWWLRAQKGITYIRRNGDCYLVRKKNKEPITTVIGRVDEATALLFPETTGL